MVVNINPITDDLIAPEFGFIKNFLNTYRT